MLDELELLFKDTLKEAETKAFVKGGMQIIDTLRGAMKVSNSDIIYPQWLDTAEKELQEFLK